MEKKYTRGFLSRLNISKKLIESILKQTTDPFEISRRIKKHQDINFYIKNIALERKQAKEKYDKVLEEIKGKEKEIQERCDHLDISKFGDPSGGNDSSYQCNICERWFEYIERI